MFNYSIRAVYRFHFSSLLDKRYWFCTLMQHETVLNTIGILRLAMCTSYGNWDPCWRIWIFQIFTAFKFPGEETIFKDHSFYYMSCRGFFSCFSFSVYDCCKFYVFKTNSLCNIFSDNNSFTVVVICACSNLNNFTIVSSYRHAIFTRIIVYKIKITLYLKLEFGQ